MSKKTKPATHTPGPWGVLELNYGCKTIHRIGHEDADNGSIFSVQEIGFTDGLADEGEDAANARLIAASPDMLRSLILIATAFSDGDLQASSKKVAVAIESIMQDASRIIHDVQEPAHA